MERGTALTCADQSKNQQHWHYPANFEGTIGDGRNSRPSKAPAAGDRWERSVGFALNGQTGAHPICRPHDATQRPHQTIRTRQPQAPTTMYRNGARTMVNVARPRTLAPLRLVVQAAEGKAAGLRMAALRRTHATTACLRTEMSRQAEDRLATPGPRPHGPTMSLITSFKPRGQRRVGEVWTIRGENG